MNEEKENKQEPRLVFWAIVLVGTYYMYHKVFKNN